MEKPLMKSFITGFALLFCTIVCPAKTVETPVLKGTDTLIVSAYDLAVKTVFQNISRKGIIKAGYEYGGEWTRDISINTRNACNTICPDEAVFSLWKVTRNHGESVGHEYWDKIIWVPAAYEQYLVTGDETKMRLAYRCSANTMEELEQSVYNTGYGLFNGGSVFNDGISGYEEPIYNEEVNSSGIIAHPCNTRINCLSTNCIYYQAYKTLAKFAGKCGEPEASKVYEDKAEKLKESIRAHFWNEADSSLSYLIDQNGDVHHFQEGLGYAFAILCDVLTKEEAYALTCGTHISKYGIPSIWPDFKRFSAQKPGRHNNLVWPHVNAFYAEAALKAGNKEQFRFELRNLAHLAMDKSGGHFYEIYNPGTGLPDGGWQKGGDLNSSIDQTWCATGYISMIFKGLWGLDYTEQGLVVKPDTELLKQNGVTALEGLKYRDCKINITVGQSKSKKGLYLNGKKQKKGTALIPPAAVGEVNIVIY